MKKYRGQEITNTKWAFYVINKHNNSYKPKNVFYDQLPTYNIYLS